MSATAFRLWVLVLAVLGAARSSSGDPVVIYSNFGAPPGYIVEDWTPRPFVVPSLYGQSDTSLYSMGFQLNEPAHLTSITLPVVFAGQLTSGITLWIQESQGGAPVGDGCAIECWRLPLPPDAQPRSASMVTAESVNRPLLQANTLYFLSMHAAGPGFDAIGWPWNNAGIEGPVSSLVFPPPRLFTGPLGAFQLQGGNSPVPEPGTLALLATGAGLVLQRVRRRRQV